MKSLLVNRRLPARLSSRFRALLLTSALGVACVGTSGVARTPASSPLEVADPPTRSDPPRTTVTSPAPVVSGAPAPPPSAAPSSDSAEGSAPEPTVEVEAPFWPDRPPRPPGEVNAAVADEEIARWNVGGRGDPEYPSSRSRFHPGTRVVVDVKHAPRRLERAIRAYARAAGYWPFRLCFEQRDVGSDEGGRSVLNVRIAPRGRVVGARLVSTELKDREAARCLVERAKRLTFRPAPGSRVDVQLTIGLWPGDAPLPRRHRRTSAAREPDPALPAGQPLPELRERLEGLRPAVGRCYASGLSRDPDLWGRLQLRVEVDSSGHVTAATQDESRFPDPEVTGCVEAALRELELPGAAPAIAITYRLGRPTSLDPPPTMAGNPERVENTVEPGGSDAQGDLTGHTESNSAQKNSSPSEPK